MGPPGKIEILDMEVCNHKVNASVYIVSFAEIRSIASDRKAFFGNMTLPFDMVKNGIQVDKL